MTFARHLASGLLLIGLCGCGQSESGSVAAPAGSSYYRVPEQTGDGWRTASLTDQNIDDAMYPTDDWIRFYLDQPLAAAPGLALWGFDRRSTARL